ncbi:hypothetical protein NE235_35250 [Actinoallomurus spadix]|uniref:Uncharacterized protein n=1 Tax=Actinoallomurus spadix TaxID=79912 RepID=A0ABP3FZE1_9ACTN|nr:hypothetical protein [Actinoallomurus spadix]MCO5991384.1 hypothetical protein [Actinoallomurus spadix]
MATRIKALLGLTAAGLAASTLVAPAAHASSNYFQFCNNHGNIPSPVSEYVAFPYRGWIESPVITSGVSPAKCWVMPVSGIANDEAVGYRLVNGQWLAVATIYFNDDAPDPTTFEF